MTDEVIYLSGPMSGISDNNYPLFERVMCQLRKVGKEVVSPHECTKDLITPTWNECVRTDIIDMLKYCNTILLLPGWSNSRGAKLELQLALALEMNILFYTEETDVQGHKWSLIKIG